MLTSLQKRNLLLVFLTVFPLSIFAQSLQNHWSNQERTLRYTPENNDFVITNGNLRFNRALYGTNTAFRVEAGDLPEFAFYMPGFGGNIRFGIKHGDNAIWLANAKSVEARYRAGSMIYTLKDDLLGEGQIILTAWALADKEGVIFKVDNQSEVKNLDLIFAYGGANGKKFSRNGDLNTDPESIFYLKPENCSGNEYDLQKDAFFMQFGKGNSVKPEDRFSDAQEQPKSLVMGIMPKKAELKISNAHYIHAPLKLLSSTGQEAPMLVSELPNIKQGPYYYTLFVPENKSDLELNAKILADWSQKAEEARTKLADRIKVTTPDPFINNLGATMAMAADAIWENPTYLHGAIGWRIRLPGWRGPYTADPLGWHDRAVTHFSAYAESQVTEPESGPSVPDEKRNWARQEEKMGNALFTSGYICRNPNGRIQPHHYDMNLVFIDALLRHFKWTGDLDYVREMWPVLMRHLAWEKRNFDGDDDGLYDAYCCIWASDALEYSGGAVSHSSAYNYYANKMTAQLAELIGEDSTPFKKEADKILNAMQENLWLPEKGWFAEYKDWFGAERTHDASALWSIYHVLDSEVADPFQKWQSTQYVTTEIPQLPVKGKGLDDNNYYVHSTTNWQPYDWSINNVVMAENLHTALAYWQAGRGDEAFQLWKSTLLDAMYLGSSPGNFAQLSYLDAARGEMYRDFADEVGMTARSLVEGLFGILPDALHGKLFIQPGLPVAWDSASIHIPDIDFKFKRHGMEDVYTLVPNFQKPLSLTLKLQARYDKVKAVKLNGKTVSWVNDDKAIEIPVLQIEGGIQDAYEIRIEWDGNPIERRTATKAVALNDDVQWQFKQAAAIDVYDPQNVLASKNLKNKTLSASVKGVKGTRTFFVKLQQNNFTWWMPETIDLKAAIEIVPSKTQPVGKIAFRVKNNSNKAIAGKIGLLNDSSTQNLTIGSGEISTEIEWFESVLPGTNKVVFSFNDKKVTGDVINWEIQLPTTKKQMDHLDVNSIFNDQVPQIFKNVYASPRWEFPTLQLPKHGVGNWCYNDIHPNIDDSGLRKLAGKNNQISIPQGFTFATPGQADSMNIAFVSQWDNYPKELHIAASGKGQHLYLLMAGSTNPMQSQIVNGIVVANYADGTSDTLELVNPTNWWPIEQDYFHDGYAFNTEIPFPIRVHLKTGEITRNFDDYTEIRGYSNRVIDGGSATVLDMPLDKSKELKSIKVQAISNEVVIGLMSATIVK